MEGGFEVPRRDDDVPPPWRLGELARYMIAYYDGQPPGDGQDNEQETETANDSPEDQDALATETEAPPSTEQTPAAPQTLVDIRGFEGIFVRYRDEIYGFVLHMIHSVESAQDLEQETFFRALRALRRQVPVYETQLKPWLYRIAYNLAVDYLRRGGLIEFEPLPPLANAEAGGPGASVVTSQEPPFDEQLADRDIMRETLKRMKPEEVAIILMDGVYGFERDEIARIFRYNPKGMRMRLSRAHAKARRIAAELSHPNSG